MLINEPVLQKEIKDDFLKIILNILGNGKPVRHIQQGVYDFGHFAAGNILPREKYEKYPNIMTEDRNHVPCYGVCDNYKQLLKKYPIIESNSREFVITLTCVRKDEQPKEGGWRWHKWGMYIGEKTPTTEYLYDEPEIEEVFCFHIYEKIS